VNSADHFRRDPGLINPRAFAALWPSLLWLAALFFLGDVAVRRVAPDTDRIKLAMANQWRRLRGQETVKSSDYLEKLKSRKAEVGEQLERSRFASRFDAPTPPVSEAIGTIGEPLLEGRQPGDRPRVGGSTASPTVAGLAPDAPKQDEASYTNRLLKAKQRVWEDREKEKDKRDPKSPG
jgi:hypothetical protein